MLVKDWRPDTPLLADLSVPCGGELVIASAASCDNMLKAAESLGQSEVLRWRRECKGLGPPELDLANRRLLQARGSGEYVSAHAGVYGMSSHGLSN